MSLISLKANGSQDQLTLPGLDDPRLYTKAERHKRVIYILSRFENVFHTESSVYLEFNKLSQADREFLSAYWDHDSDWETFRHLCSYLKVKVA